MNSSISVAPRRQFSLSIPSILQAIKSTTAHRISAELGHRGTVWRQEFFDRALRREEQLDQKIDYMVENPVRAGLARKPVDYP